MAGRDDWRERTSETDLVDELLQPSGPHPRTRLLNRVQRGIGNAFVIIGALVGLLAVAYVVDVVLSAGKVPRGVTVNGVSVAGLDRKEAEAVLRRELGPRVEKPVELRAGEVTVSLDPGELGLAVNWAATVERAARQPWDPWTRALSFFREQDTPLVTVVDERTARERLDDLVERRINRPAVDGGIGFRAPDAEDDVGRGAVQPQAIEPKAGVRVSGVDTVVEAMRSRWPGVDRFDLPVEPVEPKLTSRAVDAALEGIVRPLLAGPILLRGNGVESVLLPEDVRRALRFEIRHGELHVMLDHAVLRAAVATELRASEKPAKNAALVSATGVSGVPKVLPSEPGARIDWDRTFTELMRTVTRPAAEAEAGVEAEALWGPQIPSVPGESREREVPVVYDILEPAVTTDDLLRSRHAPN
ncbi:peptidoglycan binding domain-containing protein [Saccharomonospora viridis]|uniref:YoaR-like putative peptidoglycan binding domain-containing protein n=1 Tax=Saccharomonospora viridis TaxID=1852 RepID=A0A837DBN7_9PSEU|nr:peptidoglycan binding domain-containing protein [Saccharomonospora viridis]KHF44615.1 hypothetical protein MINT15_14970 [Saccharomonospora viridis]SFP24523.1 hypothetical protein SAMN02982918_1832 [Saccharomonospora viridis]